MSKIKLPEEIAALPNGPHKQDMIRHYKKKLKQNKLVESFEKNLKNT